MVSESPAPVAGKSLAVKTLLEAKGESFGLKLAAGGKHLGRLIRVSEVNRPGLALSGHLESYRSERVQIIGRGEHAFCLKESANTRLRSELLKNLVAMLSQPDTPCVVVTAGLRPPLVLVQACNRAKVPLFETALDTADFVGELSAFLEEQLALLTRIHGVLVDVYGLGVLIQGDPGIGKSECALELVKRGHILVADDIVEIQRKRGNMLWGRCPSMLKHYMEVRGLGIIDVELLFGVGAIMEHTHIEMGVRLMSVNDKTSCDRTGLEQACMEILGVSIPSLCIPVTPGRNLAVLIEVAALNQRLKSQGIFAANEFNNRLINKMKASGRNNLL